MALIVLIILRFGYIPWHNRCERWFNKKCDIITYFKSNIARTFNVTNGYNSRKESCEYVNHYLNCWTYDCSLEGYYTNPNLCWH